MNWKIKQDAISLTDSIKAMASDLRMLDYFDGETELTISTYELLINFDHESIGYIIEDLRNSIEEAERQDDLSEELECLVDDLNAYFTAYPEESGIRQNVTVFM